MNSSIHRRLASLLLVATTTTCAGAALPPAERILPRDTIAFVSIPEAGHAREEWSRQPPAQLWSAPAMQAFRETFEARARASLLDPLAAFTGIDWAELIRLAEGQLTCALVPADTTPEGLTAAFDPAPLLIMDAGANAERLTAFLEAARQRELAPPGQRAERVIDGITRHFILQPTDSIDRWLDGAFPRPDGAQPPSPRGGMTAVCFAQIGEVLVASTSTNAVAEVISRIQPDPRRMVDPLPLPLPRNISRGSLGYGFLNPRVVLQRWRARLQSRSNPQISPALRRTVDALGLDLVQTAFLSLRAQPQGWSISIHIDVGTRERRGLLKLLELIPAPATPPSFIPDDVLSFTRLRVSGPALWTSLQSVLRDIYPTLHGFVQLLAGYAGKTEDADFDFEKQVIGLLGDDWIHATFPGANQGARTERVFWMGSPQPDPLATNLRLVASPTYLATFLPPSAPAPTREIWEAHGHPVVSLGFRALPFRPGATGAVHFASTAGGVAFSSSAARIEQLLASNPGRSPLSEQADFKAAMAAVGAAAGGWVDYRNERESLRILFARLDEQPGLLTENLGWAAASETATRTVSAMASWADPRRLPPFERIKDHLGIRVGCANLTPRGFTFTIFRPTPQLP